MAKWKDRYKTPTDGKEAFLKAVAPIEETFPQVASVLAGCWAEDGTCEVPPYGVRLFINGGVMKFMLSRKDEKLIGYGVISNPADILGSVEVAITKDEIGWKMGTEQTLPY